MVDAARIRMMALLSLAAATAGASFYPTNDTSVVASPRRHAQGGAASARLSDRSEADSAEPVEEEQEVDPFAPRGWQAPPPVEIAPKVVAEAVLPAVPAPPPGPPPLPYKFMGLMDDGDTSRQMVYLSKGDQIVVVQGGETLDGTYKVLHADMDRVEFEHLPTGEKQVLNIAANDK